MSNERQSASPALQIEGLQKQFGRGPVVNRLELLVPKGEFHALLGMNGAGKTTTLRMVAGLLRPDAGTIHVCGHDVEADAMAAKRCLAFLPDEPLLYGQLRPLEFLAFVAGLWGVAPAVAEPRAEQLLRELDLWSHTGARIDVLSHGMRQKLALAGGLIHDPELLILDEPLTGLDAASARHVKDVLLARVQQGKTVILTTHIMELAERLAQRISVMHEGRIVATGHLDELRALMGTPGAGTASLETVFLHLTAREVAV
jgi:ABC-2 type transport system ATP-binding protein